MRVIQLDGTNWKTPRDFHQALFDGIEQGRPHGLSVDAFIDSMIWGGMGGVEPPYTVCVVNVGGAPKEVVDEVISLSSAIERAKLERQARQGVDVAVTIACPELSP